MLQLAVGKHSDFMLFLDNYIQEIEKTCVKKYFFKKGTHKKYCE